jgi:hypothetical protein
MINQEAATKFHGERVILIADWNSYSDGKPWFAPDGIHLNTDGAFALARFLRTFLAPLASPQDDCGTSLHCGQSPSLR